MNILLASVYVGLAVAASAWLVLSVVFAKRTNRGIDHRFELERREQIREKNPIYRYFEPSIDEIAASIESKNDSSMKNSAEYLSASAEPLPWKASEFLATKIIESVVLGLVALGFLRILSYSWPCRDFDRDLGRLRPVSVGQGEYQKEGPETSTGNQTPFRGSN